MSSLLEFEAVKMAKYFKFFFLVKFCSMIYESVKINGKFTHLTIFQLLNIKKDLTSVFLTIATIYKVLRLKYP